MCSTAFFLLLVGVVVYFAVKKAQPPAAAAIVALAVLASSVYGQNCPGGICPTPSRYVSFGQPYLNLATAALGQQQYQWRKHETYPDHWVLWLGGQHCGTYRSDQGLYYPWLGARYGDGQKTAPISPPAGAGQPVENFGMAWTAEGHDRWTAGGKEISATAAARDLTDDSGRSFIVGVFPDKAKVDALRKDWQTSTSASEWKEKYHLQAFESSHPIVGQRGYSDGLFVIGPDGKELARAPSYSDMDGLLDILKRLRDGGGAPLISPQINVPTWVLVAGLVLVGYLFGKRSN